MKRINCVIADDEPLAREVIENYAGKIDRLNLTSTCNNGADVFNILKSHAVDLLFLDIQMPHLTGIELLRTLKNPPAVIMTTAYREFALEGYELNVIDYLLKPISFERFLKAVDKYEMRVEPGNKRMEINPVNNAKTDEQAFIYIKFDKRMVRIMLRDILYIEGLKDYVKIHTVHTAMITYQTMTYFEEKLPANQFIRVHRSYIVSINHIDAYSASKIEIGKNVITIGNTYMKEAIGKLQR